MPRLCSNVACNFSASGGRQQVAGALRCVFCDPDLMQAWCLEGSKRRKLTQMLKSMPDGPKETALAIVPEDFREHFRAQLSKQKSCNGLGEEACDFALRPEGGPAEVRSKRGQCLFCRPTALLAKCETPQGRHVLATKMRKMAAKRRARALEHRIPAQWREVLVGLLADAPDGGVRKKPAARRRGEPVTWPVALPAL